MAGSSATRTVLDNGDELLLAGKPFVSKPVDIVAVPAVGLNPMDLLRPGGGRLSGRKLRRWPYGTIAFDRHEFVDAFDFRGVGARH
jgi:hypothetical protein